MKKCFDKVFHISHVAGMIDFINSNRLTPEDIKILPWSSAGGAGMTTHFVVLYWAVTPLKESGE